MRNTSDSVGLKSSNRELLDEIEHLREKLAASEAASEFIPNTSAPANLQSSNQELLAENECLREKLTAGEAASEFKQKLLQTLSTTINIGHWEWDEIGNRPLYLSKDMAAIVGMSLESLYEMYQSEEDFYSLVYPEDLEHYIANLGAVLRLDHPHRLAPTFDYRIVRPNGEVRSVRELEYGILEEDGVILRSFGAIQDITDHQESLQALRESEQRYSSLFSQLPLGVQEQDYSSIKKAVDKLQAEGVENLKEYFLNNSQLLRDIVSETRMINVNETLLEIHGTTSREEFFEAEEDVTDWWCQDWVEFYASEIAALADPDKIHYWELEESRMDDSVFQTRLITSVVKGDEDTWKRVLTIVEDVTERKKYENNLIVAKTKAEEASRAKTEFLSNMSHELRTPLNAILGFSQLFECDQSLGKKQQTNALAIHNAGQHLLNLIDEILDLSRIETGNVDLLIEPISLGRVVKDGVNWVNDLAESRGVTIDFNPDDYKGVIIDADSIRLKQIFLNLLSNAVKYNREDGKISIGIMLDDQGWACISITDTGHGISTARLDELFKPFNRLGAEFTAIEGTGIGLVITKQLVELMHGELEVDSNPGEGSTFTVKFQATRTDQTDNDTLTIDPNSTDLELTNVVTSWPHILVVEDNLVNQELVSAQLDVLGYSADYAINGIAALELWKTGNYRLLLTDIRMPEMDGYELITQIRAMESDTPTPIIAATANAMESDVQRCLEVGADDVISKPLGLNNLKRALRKWIPRQAAFGTTTVPTTPVQDRPAGDAIDLSILSSTVGEKTEVQHRLLRTFIDALPKAIDDIRQACDLSNYEQLEHCAHRLKSSSSSLGATQVAKLCQTIELACREGRNDDFSASVSQLVQAAEPVVAFVETHCGDSRRSPDPD